MESCCCSDDDGSSISSGESTALCVVCQRTRLAICIASYLEQKCESNCSAHCESRFDIAEDEYPTWTLETFLKLICKSSPCSEETLATSLVYLERWSELQQIGLSWDNIWTLLVVSVAVAGKFHDDSHYNNAFYAELSGFGLERINVLEVDFIFQLGFRLVVEVSLLEWNMRVLLASNAGEREEY